LTGTEASGLFVEMLYVISPLPLNGEILIYQDSPAPKPKPTAAVRPDDPLIPGTLPSESMLARL
jgi:hypothetical protein